MLRKLVERDGLSGLFKGLKPMLVSLGVSNFLFFYWHALLKNLVRAARNVSDRHLEIDLVTGLLLAFMAGCINVILTSPLWVAMTRMTGRSKEHYKGLSIFDVVLKIRAEYGIQELWSGLTPSLVLVSNPTIQFVAFEKIKAFVLRSIHGVDVINEDHEAFLQDDGCEEPNVDETQAIEFIESTMPEMTSAEAFFAGGLSKWIATFFTYPLQIAQTELRSSSKFSSTLDCLVHIYEKHGVWGWFKGFEAKIMQTVMNSAIMFLVYEKLSHAVFIFMVRRRLRRTALQ